MSMVSTATTIVDNMFLSHATLVGLYVWAVLYGWCILHNYLIRYHNFCLSLATFVGIHILGSIINYLASQTQFFLLVHLIVLIPTMTDWCDKSRGLLQGI